MQTSKVILYLNPAPPEATFELQMLLFWQLSCVERRHILFVHGAVMHGGQRVLEVSSDFQAGRLFCCVIGGKARDAQKVACCLCSLVSISPRDCFLSLFPTPFPAPSLSISLRVSLAHTSPPNITVLWEHAKCDHPCPFLTRLDCGRSAADRRMSGSFGAGNKKGLCRWEAQQIWEKHATTRLPALFTACALFCMRLGWRAWIFRGSIRCRSAVVALFRPEHLVWCPSRHAPRETAHTPLVCCCCWSDSCIWRKRWFTRLEYGIRLLPIGGGGNEERVSVGSITGRHRVHQHETTGHEQRHADFLLNGGNCDTGTLLALHPCPFSALVCRVLGVG
ncbi:unnamed protein product [Ectocarpus sp. 12 AP-2014]